MLFYNVELKTLPKIKYNCAVVAPKHHAKMGKNASLLELCYIESGAFVFATKERTLVCDEGHLVPLVFSEECEIFTEDDRPVRLISLGLDVEMELKLVDSLKLKEKDTQELMTNMLAGNRFLLPVEGFSSNQFDWLSSYLKKIISCNPNGRIGEETRALSLFLELMSKITKASMNAVAFDTKAFSTSAIAYSEMVVAYIIKNYRKKISVIEIAEEFGLTTNYLHAIFKQVKGTTIIEYLTSYRMERAKVYIERFGLKAYEAAEMVGIDDPAYFSRLFKKMYGISINKFKSK